MALCRIGVLALLLVYVRGQSSEDDGCDPNIADTCFQDVADDLHFIFDPMDNFLEASNTTALADLCNAWKDSLDCVNAIIETSCSEGEGRDKFDVWNEGLKRVVEFLCIDNMSNLRAVVTTVRCWSTLKFVQCTEQKAEIGSVAALLKTPLYGTECDVLKTTVHDCNMDATNHQCPESPVVQKTLEGALHAFFSDVDCMQPYSEEMSANMADASSDDDDDVRTRVSAADVTSGSQAAMVAVALLLLLMAAAE